MLVKGPKAKIFKLLYFLGIEVEAHFVMWERKHKNKICRVVYDNEILVPFPFISVVLNSDGQLEDEQYFATYREATRYLWRLMEHLLP